MPWITLLKAFYTEIHCCHFSIQNPFIPCFILSISSRKLHIDLVNKYVLTINIYYKVSYIMQIRLLYLSKHLTRKCVDTCQKDLETFLKAEEKENTGYISSKFDFCFCRHFLYDTWICTFVLRKADENKNNKTNKKKFCLVSTCKYVKWRTFVRNLPREERALYICFTKGWWKQE